MELLVKPCFTRSSMLDGYQVSEYVSVVRSDKISNNSRYLFLQKAPFQIFDKVLNTPLCYELDKQTFLYRKKKSNFVWYFVKPSHSRLLRRKKLFDVKSINKIVSLSVKPFAIQILPNKNTTYPISIIMFFSLPTSLSCKMRLKKLSIL